MRGGQAAFRRNSIHLCYGCTHFSQIYVQLLATIHSRNNRGYAQDGLSLGESLNML